MKLRSSAVATIFGIYWLSSPFACQPAGTLIDSLDGPLLSRNYPACVVGGAKVSICPGMFDHHDQPFDLNRPIHIIGAYISCLADDPGSLCVAEAGSGHGGDGADIFVQTAGTGPNITGGMFKPATGIPQGGNPASHIDVYARCVGSGAATVMLNAFYTADD